MDLDAARRHLRPGYLGLPANDRRPARPDHRRARLRQRSLSMSPQLALRSSVFGLYFTLVVAIAIVSGVTIALLRRWSTRDVTHAGQSFRAWLIIAPTALAAVFLGREVTILFIFALSLAGQWEYARATGLSTDRPTLGVMAFSTALLAAILILGPLAGSRLGWLDLYRTAPLLAIVLILCVPIVHNRTAGALAHITLATFGFFYIGWMFGHLALLANTRHPYGYLMYLVFAV